MKISDNILVAEGMLNLCIWK